MQNDTTKKSFAKLHSSFETPDGPWLVIAEVDLPVDQGNGTCLVTTITYAERETEAEAEAECRRRQALDLNNFYFTMSAAEWNSIGDGNMTDDDHDDAII